MNKEIYQILKLLAVLGTIILIIAIVAFTTDVGGSKFSTFDNPSEIIDTHNVRVRQWKHYWEIHPELVDTHFRNFYYPTIYKMFVDSGFISTKAAIYSEIPTVESGWKTLVKNDKSTAAGLWQFLYGTGTLYGVEGNERHDPLLSTRSAISYIKDLDTFYQGDYNKVLFAYAMGVAGLSISMKKSKTTNPWLADLPTEAYHFAPKVLGACLYFRKE